MQIINIKKDAKLKLSGNYIKCASSSLLYFVILSLLTYLQNFLANIVENVIFLAFIQIIFLLFNWILGYSIIANILDLVDVKTNSITDFINTTIKHFVRYTKLGFAFLLKIIYPLIINFLVFFYWLGTLVSKMNKLNFLCFNQDFLIFVTIILIFSIIVLIYYILKYVLVAYIYHDKPTISNKEILDKSEVLMKKNKLNFILLLLSFLHWFLLSALLLLILNIFIEGKYLTPFMVFFYSLIRPYIIISKSEFYKELAINKEK